MDLYNDYLFTKSNLIRVVLEDVTYSSLIISAEQLYKCLSDLLLNKENMFFYCAQRTSCRTLTDTRKYVRKLISKGILNAEINSILIDLGWDSLNINTSSSTFQGDLGEYLMSIIVERLNVSNALISKVSLKTSPRMPSYGNDNIYFDCRDNILYYGESKFYNDSRQAVIDAYDSLKEHLNGVTEISYIKNHTSNFIANKNKMLKKVQKKFESCKIDDIKVKTISFIMSDDKYNKNEFENIINSIRGTHRIPDIHFEENILIFLPVISKDKFLIFFEKEVAKIC